MAIRAYVLYAAAAAAQNAANLQILKPGEILGLSFAMYAATGNGQAAEVSTAANRQWGTNNTQGIVGAAVVSNSAGSTGSLHANQFVALPPGCKVNTGDILYLHTTQLGSGGSATVTVTVYVRE